MLYTQPDLHDQITRLRARHHRVPAGGRPAGQRTGEESWLRRLELAHTRIRELTDEIASLRTQLAVAHGRQRADRITTPPAPHTN
ncbi:hypothetical protein [Nocardia aurantia]|uniref:Uncharacterized protein n=1 Tax=Nocardia aurantia TaxID=2585199 RepID=A0A7K0DNJ2_9NOCA|nr:hypothetical protein [Nocardia aurantia]MQY27289.1 hypothetical protein [Nocardia aurantia]